VVSGKSLLHNTLPLSRVESRLCESGLGSMSCKVLEAETLASLRKKKHVAVPAKLLFFNILPAKYSKQEITARFPANSMIPGDHRGEGLPLAARSDQVA
jgi:hypothetical protein